VLRLRLREQRHTGALRPLVSVQLLPLQGRAPTSALSTSSCCS
jgi:hypothetical protein